MKRTNTRFVLLLAIMLIPDAGFAQQCPVTDGFTAYNNQATARGDRPASFFSSINYCSTQPVGMSNPPTECQVAATSMISGTHFLIAKWASTAARTAAASMSPSAGCRFYCGNFNTANTMRLNTCMVKAPDGLPVELMEFSVEE